jgi:uncharacterized protein (TIGR03437 family)
MKQVVRSFTRLLLLGTFLSPPIGRPAVVTAGVARIEATAVPQFGVRPAIITGRVAGADPRSVRVAPLIFISGLGFFSKPSCSQTTVLVQDDGTFSAQLTTGGVDETATIIVLLLVPATAHVPCVLSSGGIPKSLDDVALDKLVIQRPDPNRRSIDFSGERFFVKRAVEPVGPGPNRFSDSEQSVFLDSQGYLHLKLLRINGEWHSAEVYTAKKVGFGTYTLIFVVPPGMHPCQVFGAYTWAEAETNSRELDAVEVSRFCDPQAQGNSQVVVQPFDLPGNRKRFDLPAGVAVTQVMKWDESGVAFQSFAGDSPSGVPIHEWTFLGAVTSPDSANLAFRLNLWWFDEAGPERPGTEFVIRAFRYEPIPEAMEQPAIAAITNAATFDYSALAACSLFSIFGTNLAAQPASAPAVPLPRELGGTTVLFNGVAVPLLYASSSQVNGQIPCDAPAGANTVVVRTAGGTSAPSTLDIASSAIGSFRYDDRACIAAVSPSFQLITRETPVLPGSIISLFLTGMGRVDPAVPTGEAAGLTPLSFAIVPFEARVGDANARILYMGAAPGLVGVGQANIQLPESLANGWLALRIAPQRGGIQAGCLLPVGSAPLNAPGPLVERVTPRDARAGAAVTIHGANFASGAQALFGTTPATGVVVSNPTTIQATAPEGTGTVSVSVRNPDGQQATLTNAFTYITAEGTWIGPAGGTVSGDGGGRLVIPPGALGEQRRISLRTHVDDATLPGALLGFRGGATFGPSGLVFELPVTITLPLNAALEPGTQSPLYEFNPTDGSWNQTGFQATVGPGGRSASAEVTHFSTFVIVGSILEPGLAGIFGLLAHDAGHIPYAQLFADYRSRLSTLFQIGGKGLHAFGGGPRRCYENVGLDAVLTYSVTEVATAGALPVELEADSVAHHSGREGTIRIEYNFETSKRISSTDPTALFPADTEHALQVNANVWISCGAPDLVLTANKPDLDAVAREQATVTAQLVCGTEAFAGQEIRFKATGTGTIGSPSETTAGGGTAATTLTALTNQTCTSDSASVRAEYQACTGEPEQMTLAKTFDMPTKFELDGEWTAVEVADERACDEGVNTYRRTVVVTEGDGQLEGSWPGGSFSTVKNQCALSGFGFEIEDGGVSYDHGSGTVATSGRSMSASSTWTWVGKEESCRGSSKFTLTR